MISYVVTTIAVVLAIVFALLIKVWTGFAYFVLTVLLLISLFWGVWQVYKYFTSFKEELKEKFAIFKAETINKNKISSEYFEENIVAYKKQFNKKMFKVKFINWFVILFCFACAFAFLIGMILY